MQSILLLVNPLNTTIALEGTAEDPYVYMRLAKAPNYLSRLARFRVVQSETLSLQDALLLICPHACVTVSRYDAPQLIENIPRMGRTMLPASMTDRDSVWVHMSFLSTSLRDLVPNRVGWATLYIH